jgi:4-hydroxybenzoyl-CoA thioesterase
MARIKLELPDTFPFTTEIPIRIGDINYGNHLGNDALLSLIHEARVHFLKHWGYSELNIEGAGIIMNDAALVYRAEALYGEILRFEIAAVDFHRFGCDLVYRISSVGSGKEIARAKTGIVFFNYAEKKLVEVSAKFGSLFSSAS